MRADWIPRLSLPCCFASCPTSSVPPPHHRSPSFVLSQLQGGLAGTHSWWAHCCKIIIIMAVFTFRVWELCMLRLTRMDFTFSVSRLHLLVCSISHLKDWEVQTGNAWSHTCCQHEPCDFAGDHALHTLCMWPLCDLRRRVYRVEVIEVVARTWQALRHS